MVEPHVVFLSLSIFTSPVAPLSKVWVQTLAAGPRDVALNASYKHTEVGGCNAVYL